MESLQNRTQSNPEKGWVTRFSSSLYYFTTPRNASPFPRFGGQASTRAWAQHVHEIHCVEKTLVGRRRALVFATHSGVVVVEAHCFFFCSEFTPCINDEIICTSPFTYTYTNPLSYSVLHMSLWTLDYLPHHIGMSKAKKHRPVPP